MFIFFLQIHGTLLSPCKRAGQRLSLEKIWWCRKMRKRLEECQRQKTYFVSSWVNALTFHWMFCNCCRNSLFILTILSLEVFKKHSLANFHHAVSILIWCFLGLLLTTWSWLPGLHFMHLLSYYKCIISSNSITQTCYKSFTLVLSQASWLPVDLIPDFCEYHNSIQWKTNCFLKPDTFIIV